MARMDADAPWVLYGNPGWGSAIVEAQLQWYGLPFRVEAVGDLRTPEAQARLAPLNPVVQVPTLVLPSGEVMTESAAITLLLADTCGRDDLVPGPGAPERAAFLRWLVYLVASVYPTFTFADEPTRFVPAEVAGEYRARVDAYALRLWRVVEAVAGAPWLLGARMSALDLYIAVMTQWRPRRAWFEREAPRLAAIAARADALATLRPVWARNFPG